jgi:hypothetical protein
MATFTIVLKTCIDLVKATPENGYAPIGLGIYPIFDEAYRGGLNQKIVDHYWNREIGMETIEMFSFAMKRKMNEIMPYYNKLYVSERIEFDALVTMDITTTGGTTSQEDTVVNRDALTDTTASSTEDVVGNRDANTDNVSTTTDEAHATTDANNTTDTDSHSRSVQSQTPQTMLSGNEDYAASAADVNSDGTTTSVSDQSTDSNSLSDVDGNTHLVESSDQSTQNDAEGNAHTVEAGDRSTSYDSDITNHVIGYQGIPSNLIMAYRASLLNIDMQIIAELEECFMLVWDNGDEYTQHNNLLSNFYF